jgi:hypothetical protein
LPAIPADFLDSLFDKVFVEIIDDNRCTLTGEFQRYRSSYAASGASDQRYLSG